MQKKSLHNKSKLFYLNKHFSSQANHDHVPPSVSFFSSLQEAVAIQSNEVTPNNINNCFSLLNQRTRM